MDFGLCGAANIKAKSVDACIEYADFDAFRLLYRWESSAAKAAFGGFRKSFALYKINGAWVLRRSVYYSTIQISFCDLKKEIGNHSVISIFHFQFEIRNQKSGSIFWFSFIIWNWKSEISFYFLIFILQSLKRNWKIENRLCRLY